MRLRALPVILFAGTLLLSVRVGGLWHDLSIDAGSTTAAQTNASAAASTATAPALPAVPATPVALAPAAASAASATPAGPPKDPFAYTDEEINVLQSLSKRRDELDARARQVEERETILAAAEKRVDDKIAELKALQQSIEALVKKQDAERDANLQSLVKIYETMKPKEAALIFQQLDKDVVLNVVEHMKEAKVALILAQMDPAQAKEVTLGMAQRQKPQVQ